MIITDVQTILLTGPCTNDPFLSEARSCRSAAFVRIRTNTEIDGLGETYAGYFIPEIVPDIVDFFKPILIGKDPEQIDQLWAHMYHCGNFWCRTGVGLQVLTAIEAALWDIRGKACNMPVYKLLCDQAPDRLFCYATGGPSNYPLEKLFRKVEHYCNLGFKAVKLSAGAFDENGTLTSRDPHEAATLEVQKAAAITRQFGADLGLMLDGHMGNWPNYDTRWTFETAQAVMTALEPYGLIFFEEPLHYNDRDGYRRLAASTSIPIAGGECLAGLGEWQPYIDDHCFDVGQPDAAYVGGLTQFMRIAEELAKTGRHIAPHSWAAGGGFMQNIHAGFAAGNTTILEIAPDYGPLHAELIGEHFQMKDGFVLAPQAPGLGIQLTEETIARYRFVPGSGEFNSVPGKVLQC